MKNESTVWIYYTKISSSDKSTSEVSVMDTLPPKIQEETRTYLHLSDQRRVAAGKLLLRHALRDHNQSTDLITRIEYGKVGKPFIRNCFEFNLTHSGDVIACAVCKNEAVGIDVERIREIRYDYFQNYFSESEWEFMERSGNKKDAFFTCWTQKESVMKADGRGMEIPLQDIRLDPKKRIAWLNHQKWNLISLDLDHSVAAHLCLRNEPDNIRLMQLNYSELG